MEPTVWSEIRRTVRGAALQLDDSDLFAPAPRGRLLSNGRYTTLITNAGTGFSRCAEIALTRWSGDRTEDAQGSFVYLRDRDSGAVSSFGHQPVGGSADRPGNTYAALFADGEVCLRRTDANLDMRMDLCVAPAADLEFRRCTVQNRSRRRLRLDLTTCLDVVLNTRSADAQHPAFSKLFVQTHHADDLRALLAVRRPREANGFSGCMIHWLVPSVEDTTSLVRSVEFETDRFAFLGRGRGLNAPRALDPGERLGGTVGNVLDPVLSLRLALDLEPDSSRTVVFALGAAASRNDAIALCRAHGGPDAVEQAFAAARARERGVAERLGIVAADAEAFHDMAVDMLYGNPRLRAADSVRRCGGELGRLADLGIDGMRPMVLVEVGGEKRGGQIERFARAQAFWADHGFDVDVVYLTDTTADADPAAIERRQTSSGEPGGGGAARVVRRTCLSPEETILLEATAAVVVRRDGTFGMGEQEADRCSGSNRREPRFRPASATPSSGPKTTTGHAGGRAGGREGASAAAVPADASLLFDNGHGGFASDGSEYVIRIGDPQDRPQNRPLPPLPWTHVIANETFGFLISERGAGCTWSVNSRLNRLTPWYNDPVADPHGEAIYIRDEEAGTFWSPLPGPVAGDGTYEVRYGFGRCRFLHASADLDQRVTLFVPREDPAKVTEIRLRNDSDRPRTLGVFVYYRLVLGGDAAETAPFVWTRIDRDAGCVLARNPLRPDFAERVAFAAICEPDLAGAASFTTDRRCFIGRNGSVESPAAVRGETVLDDRDGAGLDPCFAIHVPVRLGPGETATCTALFGEAADEAAVGAVLSRFREPFAAPRSLEAASAHWRALVASVKIATPSPAIDLMVNGWLLYQTLSCRLWGRSAFYQSGGAFGFRDQLQDAAALVHTRPDLTRRQILLHAAHQFVEGDVMHWWHPPASRGMRTRFADDLLWLPLVTTSYLEATGDATILDESAPFMRARALHPGEDETYLLPEVAAETASVFEHCCRALDRSLTKGAHGLPLMGTGDWNDGMNRVGREGRGESVWLGFFLYDILGRFAPLCRHRGEHRRADDYDAYRNHLAEAVNDAGWDGAWYRRAYYDDGTPLGTADGDECRIDALVQAWAVISGAAPADRVEQALDALERHLVSAEDGLIRLLAPPFDRTPHDPGYIKGYLSGVRENGGQYTHAALWAIRALAEAGRRDRAARLLEMLSPVTHGGTAEAAARYKVEPYVVAADVYGSDPHIGRGGWTWYTGAAGWMYRVVLETLLGVRMSGGTALVVEPRLPAGWPEARLDWSLSDGTVYSIVLRHGGERRSRVLAATIDGTPAEVGAGAARVPLRHDGSRHRVIVDLG